MKREVLRWGSGKPEGDRKMGMLLSFAPTKAAKPRQKMGSGTTASIIIFPGVRYERVNPLDSMAKVRKTPELPKPAPIQY